MSTRSDLLAALAEIDSEIRAAEERIADLRLERRGAEALLKRLGVSIQESPEEPAPRRVNIPRRPQGEGALSRLSEGNAKFVADVLVTDPDGLTLAVIEAKTAEKGQPLNYDQVRSAVTYLKRKGLAEQAGRGVWRLVDTDSIAPQNADSPAVGAGLSVLPNPATEGGDDGAAYPGDRDNQLPGWNDRDSHHPSVMEG